MPPNFTLTPQQALDVSLKLEGETPEGVPVKEYVSKVALRRAENPDVPEERRRLPSWKDSGELRLSSVPTEGLYLILSKDLGNDWHELELPVVLSRVFDYPVLMDEGGMNKVIALHLLMSTPNGHHPFYTRIPGFEWMCKALVGKVGRVNNHMIPTVKDMCLSSYIAYSLRPRPFSEDVRSYIAAACIYRGMWALPSYLEFAQDKIYQISRARGLEINEERVALVRKLAYAELQDPTAIPDDPDTEEEIQALRLVDLTTRVAAAIQVADNHVEEYLRDVDLEAI